MFFFVFFFSLVFLYLADIDLFFVLFADSNHSLKTQQRFK